MEYWTEDGLSAVASGVGVPLYVDRITKECSRLDYARVCVMLDYSTVLPKHVVLISPVLQDGKEIPIKVDIKYDWLPQRCRKCCSLGHSVANCPDEKWRVSAPTTVFVRKVKSTNVEVNKGGNEVASQLHDMAGEVDVEEVNAGGSNRCPSAGNMARNEASHLHSVSLAKSSSLQAGEIAPDDHRNTSEKGKAIVIYNPFEISECPNGEDEAWNVRGLNNLGHQKAVGQLFRDHKIQFLGLIETRVGQRNVLNIRSQLLASWSWFNDYGGPGGAIWLAWDVVEVDIAILRVESQFIHCRATNKGMHTTCLISVVYGDCDMVLRRALWEGLLSLVDDAEDVPWIVMGDYNAVIDTSEVCGRAADTSASMTEFRDFVTAAELVHLPFKGCPYTWHNCSEGSRSLWKRLDRMLVNEAWLGAWPTSSYLSALPRTSDHSPIVLLGTVGTQEATPFRFDNFLARQASFLQSVATVWRHPIHGTVMYGVVCKLKSMKSVFRCKRKEKGDLASNVQQAKEFLETAQALYETHKEDLLLLLVKCCCMVYCAAVKLENMMLQQRAKLSWVKHGDQLSKVFFWKINSRRARQRVYQIHTSEGECLTEMNKVTEEFISVFQTLLGGNRRRRSIDLRWLCSDARYVLSTVEGERLIVVVTEEEIKEAFFDISEESAPSPDGYTLLFFKAAWPIIGGDVCKAVQDFFVSGRLLKQINATTLTMIPKVQMPSKVSDYRPIACCNVIYKAITKVMVKRMQQVLHLIVDQSQNAFVLGRSIANSILLAQELLAGYNQVKLPPRCTIKADIQKAYDSIEWDFLLASLKLFNFPQKFIDWVEQCISKVMISISLNGSLYGFFPSSRGLRQGDPISPYLFVIVMEVWRILLHKRVQAATDFHYHWKCKEQAILNLCFADDVLIFCKGTVQSVRVIKAVLDEFASASGLKVNPNKSQVILSRAAQSVRYEIVHIMGFQEGGLPIRYVGVPLVSTKLSIADCRALIQKIDARLAGWSHLNLTFVGRTQLIRSVMSAMHNYWASIFLLPKAVIKEIKGRMRHFLWRGSSDRGYAKVSWDQVCKPKCEGGLGIRRVMHLNQALMLKHVWRLLREDRNSIWVQWVLLHRLQRQSLWTSKVTTATWCWKQLIKICHILKPGMEYKVGNGDKFKVWLDIWHERGPLIHHYPRGPLVTGIPVDALFSAVLQQGRWAWPSETDFDVAEIIASLPQIHPGESDSIQWKLNAGRFNTAVVFSLLEPPSPTVVWHVLLGGQFKIPRHNFILWLAIKGCLSTMDRLWMNEVEDGCVLCNYAARETHTHLFFGCSFPKRCLAILKEKVRFQWPMEEWNQGIIWASRRWRGKHLWHSSSRAVLAAMVYYIWDQRNGRKFKATASSAEVVARRTIEDVRLRIISEDVSTSLQVYSLYRIWQIPWHRTLF
ncbi:UNVERIFIED_CONTAM: hypothetical protein Sradi_6976200 [Sesamum radiatum]|uniref:Reverse transcriptase domain-containing protein n=1 Tax=Sesamum radiatum TaxID=300843 RepID=A0AAW2JEA4_SESRA